MDSGKYGRGPKEGCGERAEAPARAGRIVECYHYRDGQGADSAAQVDRRQVLLEHVPALLQAAGLH